MDEDEENLFTWAMVKKSDPRTSDWLFIKSPWQPLTVLAIYLIIVFKGKSFMASRPALTIQPLLVAYNFIMVLMNFWIAREVYITTFMRPGFRVLCEAVDYTNNPLSLQLARAIWWYFFSKFIELLDTIFFIVRKKNKQVSFLHVYHHTLMPVLWWCVVRFIPGGSSFFSAFANSIIHVLMYTYYLLSAMGPRIQRYLWWKRYMTKLQLAQFLIVLVHNVSVIYFDCGFSREWMAICSLFMMSLVVLFSNFYQKAYQISTIAHVNGVTSHKAARQ